MMKAEIGKMHEEQDNEWNVQEQVKGEKVVARMRKAKERTQRKENVDKNEIKRIKGIYGEIK